MKNRDYPACEPTDGHFRTGIAPHPDPPASAQGNRMNATPSACPRFCQ
ncbi:MAG: hypothetical protein KUL75_02625 [Sterolibacterium sp.]|nr:hypothetical protein [Sterolibacterium sp.]